MGFILFLVFGLVNVCFFTPFGNVGLNTKGFAFDSSGVRGNTRSIPEDSMLKRHFIANVKSTVEAELFPRPTSSTLQRHYDSLVAAKTESRLYKYYQKSRR